MNSLKRKLIIFTGALVLLILAALTGLRIYGNYKLQIAVERYREEAGQIEIGTYAPRSVIHTDNSATWVSAGIEAFVVTPEEWKLTNQIWELPYEKWDTETSVRMNQVWERNIPTFQILGRMIDTERSSFDLDYGSGAEMDIDKLHLRSVVQVRKLLALKARMHLKKGEDEEAFQVAAVMERIAASLNHEPVLISVLVGQTIEKDYYDVLQELIGKSDEKMLSEITSQLNHLKSEASPLKKIAAAEGAAIYRTLQHKPFVDHHEPDGLIEFMHRFVRPILLATVLDLYREQAKFADRPMAKSANNDSQKQMFLKERLKEVLVPYLPEAFHRIQAVESARILASLAFDLYNHARKNGAYPKDLTAFNVPVSPYSGESVQYHINEDGSAVVSFPEADQFWTRVHKEPWKKKPRLVWRLPSIRQ